MKNIENKYTYKLFIINIIGDYKDYVDYTCIEYIIHIYDI